MASNESDRDDSGINWSSQEVAERRNRGRARRGEIQGPATQMMLDLAEVRTGSRVLDVAAGTGDQTLLAAERVGPTGFVLATDISASMLKLAADAAREAGFTNVETRVMDAENRSRRRLLRRSDMPAGTVSVLQSRERAAIDASSGSAGG
jgi:ubiquinone/menaquinone biosynthesis C-methylase UbiE